MNFFKALVFTVVLFAGCSKCESTRMPQLTEKQKKFYSIILQEKYPTFFEDVVLRQVDVLTDKQIDALIDFRRYQCEVESIKRYINYQQEIGFIKGESNIILYYDRQHNYRHIMDELAQVYEEFRKERMMYDRIFTYMQYLFPDYLEYIYTKYSLERMPTKDLVDVVAKAANKDRRKVLEVYLFMLNNKVPNIDVELYKSFK